MPRTLRILCVHGVGHQERDTSWQDSWRSSIAMPLKQWAPDLEPECSFVRYDDAFEQADLDSATIASAILRLAESGLIHGVGDMFGARGFGSVREQVRWTAGMIAQWAADESLRKKARQRVAAAIGMHDPEVICAHSLGSLVTYDLLARDPASATGRILITLGSQIGNPFVRTTLGGRIVGLPDAKHWYHLYNRGDDVFTAPLRLGAKNFKQVDTYFDISGIADHDATAYLSHENAASAVWRSLALPGTPSRAIARTNTALSKAGDKPRQRALLIGINDYPDPADHLDGCVNDVFEMSAVLQELGFDPKDIRVTLNERATAGAIRERLEWLLEDAGKDDVRFFYFSGHGAQIPAYGNREEIDHLNECLVPFDFDWSSQTALVDDDFVELYSQLPYDAHFVTILDCCHSGGMTRNGLPKARGLNPPDDIRHRDLQWNEERQMWVPRKLRLSEARMLKTSADRTRYLGKRGATKRLGRAVSLWSTSSEFERAKKAYGHLGPYTPLLVQACQEDELAYEYRHGVTSYGAFTYSLTRVFREIKRSHSPSFKELIRKVATKLHELKYRQTPVLVGPAARTAAPVSFLLDRKSARARGSRSR